MTTAIIGLFESAEFAKKVLGELARISCEKDAMKIFQDAFTDRISDRLLGAGYVTVEDIDDKSAGKKVLNA
jgi:hypothetical protein